MSLARVAEVKLAGFEAIYKSTKSKLKLLVDPVDIPIY